MAGARYPGAGHGWRGDRRGKDSGGKGSDSAVPHTAPTEQSKQAGPSAGDGDALQAVGKTLPPLANGGEEFELKWNEQESGTGVLPSDDEEEAPLAGGTCC